MPEVRLTVDAELKELWSATCLGCLVYSVTVRQQNQEIWDYYASEMEGLLQKQLADMELTQMPGISDARSAFKKFGADPSRQRVSSEALYRRIRQGKDLYKINSLVDVNNLVSLESGLSLGSYDLDQIGSEIVLRRGGVGESYAGIGKAKVHLDHLPVLSDAQGFFGSPVSDSTRAMIRLETTHALTVIYSFSGKEVAEKAMEAAKKYFVRFAEISDLQTFFA